MQRREWDNKGIDEIANKAEVYEAAMYELLRGITRNNPDISIKRHNNPYERYDYELTWQSTPGPITILIEYEVGLYQPTWANSLTEMSDKWSMGINVALRKAGAGGKHFDLFIKSSTSLNSFFAATYDYIQEVGIYTQKKGNATGIATCDEYRSIPWSVLNVKDPRFCYDNYTHLLKLLQYVALTKWNLMVPKVNRVEVI